jgi:predicted transcriptional regulator
MNADEKSSVQPLPERVRVAAALGNHSRWLLLKELSLGEPRMVSELAPLIGCSADMTSKHLAILRKAGMVVQGRGRLYQIPKQYLRTPGQAVVDYGHCLLRLDAAAV